jgi:hypothetical protein
VRAFWSVVICSTAALLATTLATREPLSERAVTDPGDPRVLADSTVRAGTSYSNILPADYVGPEACAECHQAQYERWLEHPHRTMNQFPSEDSVQGDFGNAELRLAAGDVSFHRGEDGTFRMSVFREGTLSRRYRVTRTVGSKFMQFYVGRQEVGPEPAGARIYGEHMLPFAYWFSLARWLPREYFDPNGPEKLHGGMPLFEGLNGEPDVRNYAAVCMNCHNTYPYAYRIFHENYAGFLGATVAAALDPLSRALAPAVSVAPTVPDFVALNGRLDPDKHLVTLGISCESCHFGGREHVEQQKRIRFLPTSPFTQVIPRRHDPPVSNSRHNPRTILGICVQCHSGTGDYYANGSSKGNSREAIDMYLGGCTSQLRCVDCHEPHTAGGSFGGPSHATHAATCVRCHSRYASPADAASHSRHLPEAGVNCLDCHMPRQTQGLEGLVRTHRISLPVEPSMVAQGSLNACNLCHLDKSLRWTLDQWSRGWPARAAARIEFTGVDLDRPAGMLWLESEDAALRLVATQSFARSELAQGQLRAMAQALNDPQGINRVFALLALCQVLGMPPAEFRAVDVAAPPSARRQQIEELLERLP